MPAPARPRWQRATALVSIGAGGAITGFSFVPHTAAELTSPASMPIRLMALEQASQPKPADDATLRSAIINVANYYLRMARDRTSAEMQALIWQHASTDGTDHGPSCAAFASLTLELGAHVVGQHSWVSGGRSYPWPLHKWADARVNPNPASPNVTSIVQDAQAHHRWHALGHGYKPLPGDWVVFDGHVEVVTKYAHGVLHTIGGDSLPDFSVNAHEYGSPLGAQGVLGFVDNGGLAAPPAASPDGGQVAGAQLGAGMSAIPGAQEAGNARENVAAAADGPPIPGVPVLTTGRGAVNQPARHNAQQPGRAPRGSQPGTGPGGIAVAGSAPGIGLAEPAGWPQAATGDTAIIPGLPIMAHRLPADPTAPSTTPYSRHRPSPPTAPVHDTSAQQAFISQVAPGAIAAQRRYGVPLGDDRPGHRRVGLGPQRLGYQGSQPVRHQGHGAGRQRSPADARVRERPAGHPRQRLPRVPQHRREHRRPRQAPRHQRVLPEIHGRPAEPECVRGRPHRHLRHRS